MQVIALVQRKGGVGKTTVAINLAGELARRGKVVTVIDSDPQGSAIAWAGLRRLPFTVKHELLDRSSVSIWIKNVLKSHGDLVIIDTPADLGPVFKATADIADLIVMPCGPSSLDLNAARQTIAKLHDQMKSNKGRVPAVALVATRVDPATEEGKQISEELSELGGSVGPALSNNVAFVRAFTAGEPVCVSAPGSQADREVVALADFVLGRLEQPQAEMGSIGSVVRASKW